METIFYSFICDVEKPAGGDISVFAFPSKCYQLLPPNMFAKRFHNNPRIST
jgi:hypothetical protein